MNVTFEELRTEVLQNQEVRAEYERLRPEFEFEMKAIQMKPQQRQVHKSGRLVRSFSVSKV